MVAKLPNPLAQEAASVDKSTSALTNQTRIALTAGSYADAALPDDGILRTKGGGDFRFYREVLRDDQVKSTFQQLRLAVVAAPWEVEPGAEDAQSVACAEAWKANLKRIHFDRATDEMLYTEFYGFGVGELIWEMRDNLVQLADVKVRDRGRFAFGIDGALYLNRNGFQYEKMPDRKFWIARAGADNSDELYGLGLAHFLYWPVFFKRNGIKFWLVFLEKFGMPTPVAKLPGSAANDATQRREALAVLSAIQTDSGVVIPDTMVVELLEAARSGTADYEGMRKAMDAAIAKVVLTQTMTTDDGSSRSQSETHADRLMARVKAAADLVCESFNAGPGKWFAELNFPGAVPPRVYRNTEPPEDLVARAERDAKIKTLGFEPTEEYITDTYGEGWVKSQQATEMAGALGQPDTAADFAELAALATAKAAHRNDQRAIVEAATAFANKHEAVIGSRVRQIVSYAEQTGDFDTMIRHLNEMVAEPAPEQAVEKVKRAGFMSRLLGARRGKR
jgi:phage gp29-like protein